MRVRPTPWLWAKTRKCTRRLPMATRSGSSGERRSGLSSIPIGFRDCHGVGSAGRGFVADLLLASKLLQLTTASDCPLYISNGLVCVALVGVGECSNPVDWVRFLAERQPD